MERKAHISDELQEQGNSLAEVIFQHTPDAMILADREKGCLLEANPAACSLLGAGNRASLLSVPAHALFPDFDNFIPDPSHAPLREAVCRTSSGKQLLAELAIQRFVFDGRFCLLITIRQIVKNKQLEDQLRERISLEKLVAELSTNFLRLRAPELDDYLNKALQQLGTFAQTDRAYLYLNQAQGLMNTNEWIAEGLPKLKEYQNSLKSEDFSWIHQQLNAKQAVHIPDLGQLPEEENVLKAHLVGMGIQSSLAVPMHVGDRLVGFLGFDSLRSTKRWSKENIRLLFVVGEIFASTLERVSYEESLNEVNRKLATLNEALELKIELRTHDLLEKNKQLTNFAYYNSHKIRGPLARVMGLVNLLKIEMPEAERASLLEMLSASAKELDVMVREVNELVARL